MDGLCIIRCLGCRLLRPVRSYQGADTGACPMCDYQGWTYFGHGFDGEITPVELDALVFSDAVGDLPTEVATVVLDALLDASVDLYKPRDRRSWILACLCDALGPAIFDRPGVA